MSDDQRRPGAPVCGARLRVLGAFELTVPFGADTPALEDDARRLLAVLAVSSTARAHDDLAALLWPELSDEGATATLRSVVGGVAGLVTETGRELRLAAEVQVDLSGALRRLREWQHDPGRALSVSADEIVELLGKDLLPGWTERWVGQERERFRRVRLHALESLCRQLTETGRHESAIQAGQLVVDAEPLRESSRRALIEAHLAAGNVSEAVHQYEMFAELCGKLGFAPGAELSAFFPPSPAWPVLHVRRPIHPGRSVGRGLRLDPPGRRGQVGSGTAARG